VQANLVPSLLALQAGIPLGGMPGLMGGGSDMHMMSSAAMMMAAAHAQAQHGGGSPPPASVGRGGAIKLGRGVADPVAYQHKLFIGQIPFEVGCKVLGLPLAASLAGAVGRCGCKVALLVSILSASHPVCHRPVPCI
jgi:hypothetical protein